MSKVARHVADLRSRLRSVKRMMAQASKVVDGIEADLQTNEAELARLVGDAPRKSKLLAVASNAPGLDGAIERGQAALARWVAEGVLVPSSSFAEKWGLSRQALDQAVERNELFSIKLGNKRLYPAAFLNLDRQAVSLVCKALGRADSSEKLIFWLRKQGGLGGHAPVEAVAAGEAERVAELAQDWAEERGLANAASSS